MKHLGTQLADIVGITQPFSSTTYLGESPDIKFNDKDSHSLGFSSAPHAGECRANRLYVSPLCKM